MTLYHYSRTNGQYGGLGTYYGLGGGKGKGKGGRDWFARTPARALHTPPGFAKGQKGPAAPFMPMTPEVLTQRSIQAGKKAEFFEDRAQTALSAGKDQKAAAMMAQANFFQAKSDKLENRAENLRLPYTDLPMMPKGIEKKADEALFDTPLQIADQAAPLPPPDVTPTPTTASLTAPAVVPTTLPMTPPPLLLPAPMPGMPMMGPPPAPGPMAPMMMPPPQRRLPGGISPTTAATAAAAVAASYFLFF